MRNKLILITLGLLFLGLQAKLVFADGWGTTKASNTWSIKNTRHNLTQSFLTFNADLNMNAYRNNYYEVCVYCHTPHGANSTMQKAPLWNRTNKGNTYTLYNIPLTSGQSPTQPGVNSLTCLSCHDGTTAIDSIINMPSTQTTAYKFNYKASQETSENTAFLSSWNNTSGPDAFDHYPLGVSTWSCREWCHNPGSGLPDFTAFVIGTDLTDDHPVGVQMPDTAIYDFNAPTATQAGIKFFDLNSNSIPDKNEVRLYDTGGGYEVECGSCHDPHGVPSGGAGSKFIPSFLRVSNTGSALCLTCHVK